MTRKIFVSYNFKDSEIARSVKSMTQHNGGIVKGKFVFVENDVSSLGNNAIEHEIKRIIQQCDAALFVVGNDSHNSPWINREAQLAKSLGLSIVITKLPSSNGGIPYELINTRYTSAEWGVYSLATALNTR